MYRLPKINKMAGAYIDKIAQMVGAKWFCVVDSERKEEDDKQTETLQRARDFFRTGIADNKTFDNFIHDFFLHYFCSGEVSATSSELNLYNRAWSKSHIKILDTRWVAKETDEYGNIIRYQYWYNLTDKSKEVFSPKQLCNLVLQTDHNDVLYGYSKFERIIIEALTNLEANQKQLYMFTNNSAPWLMIMLDPEAYDSTDGGKQQIDWLKEMWNSKFRGSQNANKPLVSDIVKDIKTIDVSNVDMDYLNIRKENDKDFASIFLLDPRLVGVVKETGSFGEVESMTVRQGNQQIDAYGQMVADAMTIIYKKFIDPKFDKEFKLKNAQFRDVDAEKEMSIKEVLAWVKSPNEHRVQFDMLEIEEEHMNSYSRGNQVETTPKEE